MERLSRRTMVVAMLASLAGVIALAGGCRGLMTTAVYLIKGHDVEAEFQGLKKKKVVVVCRQVSDLQFGNPYASRNLARETSRLLKERVPKIQMVDYEKVADWCDEHSSEEALEAGKHFEADLVVAVDLEHFDIWQGQTLLQGRANATVRVYDCKDEGKVVFEKQMPQFVYPPNVPISASQVQENAFRDEFTKKLADQVGRYFYAHDKYDNMMLDNSALR